jgi:hypothetical protein
MKEEIRTPTPEEILKRGTGNYINCTDYDDAIKAMEEYSNLKLQEVIKELIEESTIAFQKNEIRGNGNYLTILEILKERIT